MANFSSTALSGNNLNASQLDSELESSLPGRITHTSSSTLTSTTSGTYVTLDSQSVAVKSDEIVMVMFDLQFSCSNNTTYGYARIEFDGVAATAAVEACLFDTFTSTNGNTAMQTIVAFQEPGSDATVTYALKWYRASGAGTIYSAKRSWKIVQMKKRA